jgi:hypothetical protein
MLPRDAFLKNLPICLDPAERLALEAIGFSLDALGYAYRRLLEAAGELAAYGEAKLAEFDLTPIFVNAWAIIDHAHLARQLVTSLKPKGERLLAYVAETETATSLRNRVHHIKSNLKNLSNKAETPPLFGAFSFIFTEPGDFEQQDEGLPVLRRWQVVAVNSGKPVTTVHLLAKDPGEGQRIEHPVGYLLFHAFDHEVSLSELLFSAQRLAEAFEADVRPKVEARVRALADEHGVDPDQLLRETGVALVWRMNVEAVEANALEVKPTA